MKLLHPGVLSVQPRSVRLFSADGLKRPTAGWDTAIPLGGIVVGGRKIGKAIGFPTANIKPDEYKLVPADGVYAVEVELEDRRLTGMLSIGSNPTVNSDPEIRSVEVHIFNFDADIYGMAVRVIFRYRLRDEIRFGSISGLVRQMELDRKDAMRLLAEQQH